MTDQPAPPPDKVVTHASLEVILRAVLQDVVSEGALVKMVNVAVDNRVENMRTLISGIDRDQRNSFQDFKSAAGDFRTSSEKFQQAMADMGARMARSETSQEADKRRISDVFKIVESHEKELETIKEQLAKIDNTAAELRIDIHGDAQQTMRPSIHSLLRGMDMKLDDKFGSIQGDIRVIKDTQTRHEAYISRRQNVETWIFSTLKSIWGKQFSRWALIAGAPVIGTLLIAAADPKVAESIAQFIRLVLTGK